MSDPVQQVQAQEVYVGPRPFERSERELFFGRDRETSELLSLVISSRAVICYAPSGAGKTSLINAGLLPRLEGEGFETLPSVRVRGLVPEGIDQGKVANIYVFNALLGMEEGGGVPGALAGLKLDDYLSARPHVNDQDGFPEPRILIFDQFEELLTSYPERWQEREGFFGQVREALEADPLLRVLFVFREDFLARFEPYIRQLKPFALARFRLPLLGAQGAHAAVTGPLRGTGIRFKEGVVPDLVKELLKVRVETAQGEAVEVEGEYVEPVQLQVVCRNLWTSLPPDVQEISSEHVQAYGDVDQALKGFYESCLAEAKTRLRANEHSLRQWFEGQLVTPAGTRGIVFRDAAHTAGLPNNIVDFLENRHLVRGEWRAGSRWYELTHDRLIEPIQQSNGLWRDRRRARRAKLVGLLGLTVTVIAAMFAVLATVQQAASQQEVSQAVRETLVVEAANFSATAQVEAEVAQEDAALSKSRQLAAESYTAEDPDLALLLAVEANKLEKTDEARKSLHNILSRMFLVDGKFLSVYFPEIVPPRIKARLQDHTNWVLSVAFSPDGKRLASGGADATIILWDVETAEPVGPPLSGHNGNVLSVAFSPNGALLASASQDGQVLLWFASTGQQIGEPLLGHEGLVTSLAFSPDGNRLASAGEDGTVRIWDISTRKVLAVVEVETTPLWSVAWSPDGFFLAAGGAGSTIRLLNGTTYTEVLALQGHQGLIRSLAWSPDSRSLASSSVIEEGNQTGGEVILWEVETGREIARPLSDSRQPVRAVAFDASGTLLAIGRDDGTITLWDRISGQIQGDPLKGHSHRVYSIAFSPDGKYMASGSIDETVILWDFFTYTRSMAFSPDGKYAVSGADDNTVRVWDIATGNELANMTHEDIVNSVAYSPDGNFVVSGSVDQTVRVWDAATGKEIYRMQHDGAVTSVAFSPEGDYVASGSTDKTARIWEAATGKEVARIDHNDVSSVAFSPDGHYFVSASLDGSARVIDIENGEEIAQLQAGYSISTIAFSQDGGFLIAGTLDGTVRVLELYSKEEHARFTLDSPVRVIGNNLDGIYFVAGSERGTLRVWDVGTGQENTALSIPGSSIVGLGYDPFRHTLSIGMQDRTVLLWDLSLLYPDANVESYLELSCMWAARNFTPSEWKQYLGDIPYQATCPNLPVQR